VMLARHRPLQAAGRMSWYSGTPKSMYPLIVHSTEAGA
jgi:hypothetical protein